MALSPRCFSCSFALGEGKAPVEMVSGLLAANAVDPLAFDAVRRAAAAAVVVSCMQGGAHS